MTTSLKNMAMKTLNVPTSSQGKLLNRKTIAMRTKFKAMSQLPTIQPIMREDKGEKV